MNSVSPRRFSYLLISYTYPPVLGGSEIEAQRVSEALQKRGHKMQIICGGGGPTPPVKGWGDPPGLRGGWADRILVLNPGMKQEAKEMDFDLERVGWMPNPVDADRFHPVSADHR